MIIEDSNRYWVGHDHKGSWVPKAHYLQDRFSVVIEYSVEPDGWLDPNLVIEKRAEFSDSYNFLRVPLRWGFKNYNDAFLFVLTFPTVYTKDWREWEEEDDECPRP